MDIDITNANYLGYKRLLEFKTRDHKTFYDKRNERLDYVISFLGMVLSIVTFVSIPVVQSLAMLSICMKVVAASIIIFGTGKIINVLTRHLEKKSFKNDYPNIDMNIPLYDLKLSIDKYENEQKEKRKEKYPNITKKVDYIERNEYIQENTLDKPKQLIKK